MVDIVFPVIKGSFSDLKIATNLNNWTIEHMRRVSNPSELNIPKEIANEKDIWTYEIPDDVIAKLVSENGQDSNFRLHFKFVDDNSNWFTAGEFAKISDDNNINNILVLLFEKGKVVSSEGMEDGGIKVYNSDDAVEGADPFIRVQREEVRTNQEASAQNDTVNGVNDKLTGSKESTPSSKVSTDGRRTPRKKTEPIVFDTPKAETTLFTVTKEIGQPSFTMPEGNVLETTKEAVSQTLLLPKVSEATKGSVTTENKDLDSDNNNSNDNNGDVQPQQRNENAELTLSQVEEVDSNPDRSGSEKSTSTSTSVSTPEADTTGTPDVSIPTPAHVAPGGYAADSSGVYASSSSDSNSPEVLTAREEDELEEEGRKMRERNQAISETTDSIRYNTSLLSTILRFFSGFFGSWFGILNRRREEAN